MFQMVSISERIDSAFKTRATIIHRFRGKCREIFRPAPSTLPLVQTPETGPRGRRQGSIAEIDESLCAGMLREIV